MTEEQLSKGVSALKQIKDHEVHIAQLVSLKKDWETGAWVKIETQNKSAMYVEREHFGKYLDKLIHDANEKLKRMQHNFNWI